MSHADASVLSCDAKAAASSPWVRLRDVRVPADVAAIRNIYVPHITTPGNMATFEETVPSLATMQERVQGVIDDGFPFIVAELVRGVDGGHGGDADARSCKVGDVVGYHYVHAFRGRSAYSTTVENSIYVHPSCCGLGIGSALMAAMVPRCKALGFRQIMAVASSRASVRFHKRHGFLPCGTWHQVGQRWGSMVDVYTLQLFLNDDDLAARLASGHNPQSWCQRNMQEPQPRPPHSSAPWSPSPGVAAAAMCGVAVGVALMALLTKLRA